jgi:hypothetical protein
VAIRPPCADFLGFGGIPDTPGALTGVAVVLATAYVRLRPALLLASQPVGRSSRLSVLSILAGPGTPAAAIRLGLVNG